MDENNGMKIGLTTPEDIMYDDSYTKDFLEFLDSIKNKKEAKTLTWFEYESL